MIVQRATNALLYLNLAGWFFAAWISPLRESARDWIDAALALLLMEFFVCIAVGPVLKTVTDEADKGLARILRLRPIVVLLGVGALLYAFWKSTQAGVLVMSYAALVIARTVELARSEGDALVDLTAHIAIWFVAYVLAVMVALVLPDLGLARLPVGAVMGAFWLFYAVKFCAVYFLLLAAGELFVPTVSRLMKPA